MQAYYVGRPCGQGLGPSVWLGVLHQSFCRAWKISQEPSEQGLRLFCTCVFICQQAQLISKDTLTEFLNCCRAAHVCYHVGDFSESNTYVFAISAFSVCDMLTVCVCGMCLVYLCIYGCSCCVFTLCMYVCVVCVCGVYAKYVYGVVCILHTFVSFAVCFIAFMHTVHTFVALLCVLLCTLCTNAPRM